MFRKILREYKCFDVPKTNEDLAEASVHKGANGFGDPALNCRINKVNMLNRIFNAAPESKKKVLIVVWFRKRMILDTPKKFHLTKDRFKLNQRLEVKLKEQDMKGTEATCFSVFLFKRLLSKIQKAR